MYSDLREAVLKGELDGEIYDKWTMEYSKFINEKLYPKWTEAIKAGVKELEENRDGFVFDFQSDYIQGWLEEHSGELITQLTDTQKQAVNALIRKAVFFEGSPDSLAMLIRPVIGLHKGQAAANYNYYNAVYKSLLKNNPKMRTKTAEKRAREAAVIYAERQHRYRACVIARTELAKAYNAGEYFGIKQAQSEGLMGRVIKRSSSAGDGRVCAECRDLDGTETELDEEFPNGCLFPPYHPCCRCAVEYAEIEPLKFYSEIT